MNIAIIGHVCIDRNISENSSYTAPGGPAVFMSRVLKQMPDINLEIIAPAKELNNNNVLIYENRSKGNKRTQKAFNLKYAKPPPLTKKIRETIYKSDLIFFAPLTPDYRPDYIASLLEKTKNNSIKIISPQGYFRNFDKNNNVVEREFVEAEKILPFFDFVIVSSEDHKDINKLVRVWSKKIKVITTLGERGARYLYQGKLILAKTSPVKKENIVDSVGAGDIFTASFGYKYLLTRSVEGSLKFGNDLARQSLFFDSHHADFYLSPER